MSTLELEGIATRQGTHAPVGLGVYRERCGTRIEDFPGALVSERLSLSLPLYPQMTDDEIVTVVEALREAGP
jgi:dTDP-4-amino-4,6-dideoxygalactose transaminase